MKNLVNELKKAGYEIESGNWYYWEIDFIKLDKVSIFLCRREVRFGSLGVNHNVSYQAVKKCIQYAEENKLSGRYDIGEIEDLIKRN